MLTYSKMANRSKSVRIMVVAEYHLCLLIAESLTRVEILV